jgi:hypothetical protein
LDLTPTRSWVSRLLERRILSLSREMFAGILGQAFDSNPWYFE